MSLVSHFLLVQGQISDLSNTICLTPTATQLMLVGKAGSQTQSELQLVDDSYQISYGSELHYRAEFWCSIYSNDGKMKRLVYQATSKGVKDEFRSKKLLSRPALILRRPADEAPIGDPKMYRTSTWDPKPALYKSKRRALKTRRQSYACVGLW